MTTYAAIPMRLAGLSGDLRSRRLEWEHPAARDFIETHTSHTRATFWAATLIALGGIAVLAYGLVAARPLWVDEQMVLLNVRDRRWWQLAGPLWLDQSAPLGWLLLEKAALVALGPGERALRLVPTLFGIGTLVTAIWIGRRWMSPFGAAVLAVLCSSGEWLLFFTMELKHYSADTCLALLLPALAAWATEGDTALPRHRRLLSWWIAAACGLWFANGAVFVAPGCAVVLVYSEWRRAGWPGVTQAVTYGGLWILSLAAYYLLVLRHALGNAYLQNYWSFAFPPVDGGVVSFARWSLGQAQSFAIKPGGSDLPGLFWLTVACGFVFALARRRTLGLAFLTIPPMALALAWLRLVPPFERLVLWVVPATYVAIGLCADSADWLARRRVALRAFTLSMALACAIVASLATLDVFQLGRAALAARSNRSNYGLDDRRSIEWIMSMRRQGDVILTTHYGLAALWWYGHVNVASLDRGGRLQDGTPVFEVGHAPPDKCDARQDHLATALAGRARALVYVGFRLNLLPEGFEQLLFRELSRHGSLSAYRRFGELSLLGAFDLSQPSPTTITIPLEPGSHPSALPVVAAGCLTIAPARRW